MNPTSIRITAASVALRDGVAVRVIGTGTMTTTTPSAGTG